MNLNTEQQQAFSQWVEKGLGLSDLQRRLEEEFEIRMTYMDVRFLLIDLGLELKAEPEHADADGAKQQNKAIDQELLPAEGVTVDVDRVVQPGALVSGSVTFSDGTNAKWSLDQFGRLGLDAGDPSYRPAPEDVEEFQVELQKVLQQQGFGGV